MKKFILRVGIFVFSINTFAQSTAFTYQGQLSDGASPANGSYDLRFALFDAITSGTQQGATLTNATTAVSNGLFTVTLDFGNQFPGADRWLEIGVRTNGGGAFSALIPRQPITATPYAVQAASAGSVAAANISGSVAFSQLPPSLVTNGASGVNFTGTFSGNGAGLTNLNASQLASGTVADSALSTNVALRSGGNVFSGSQRVVDTVPTGAEALDQQQTIYNANAGGNDEWQSFTAGVSGFLTRVELRVGSPTFPSSSPGTIRIYAGEGTGGELLATESVTFAPVSLGTYQSFTFNSAVRVQVASQYTIRFNVPGVTVGWVDLHTGNPYPGGRFSADAAYDCLFKTHVTLAASGDILTVNPPAFPGNIGIGTNAPRAKLHVVGDILVSGNGTIAGTVHSPYLKFAEVTTGTTQGGNAVAGTNNWRNFNTKQFDTYNLGATNGAGGMILPAGSYQCRISAPAYAVSTHQIRLVTTNGTQLLYGTIGYSGSGAYANNRSQIDGQITLASSTTLRVQHWCEVANGGNGLGAFAGSANIWGDSTNINIFATAEFWKTR